MEKQKSTNQEDTDIYLQIPSIKEDWGGDGRGRMNLSGRHTAISPEFLPRKYQFFNTNSVSAEKGWKIKGIPDHVAFESRRLLTWHDCGASTSRVILPPNFYVPAGIFTADLELFILALASLLWRKIESKQYQLWQILVKSLFLKGWKSYTKSFTIALVLR